MRHAVFILPILCVCIWSMDGFSEPLGEVILLPEVAVIRCAEGADFVEEVPDTNAEILCYGQLRSGLVEVAATETIVLEVDRRTVRLEPGVARLRVEDTVSICVWQGAASVVGFGTIEGGRCARWRTGSSDWSLEDLPADLLTANGLPRLLEEPRIGLHFADDPWLSLSSLRTDAEARSQGDTAEGAAVESSGAAACLESTSGGSEATGTEGPEVPETEIDRAFHRVNLTVTLEGL